MARLKEQRIHLYWDEWLEECLNLMKVINHRFYPVWTVALFTGMRSGELCPLKWSDVDLESRTISVS